MDAGRSLGFGAWLGQTKSHNRHSHQFASLKLAPLYFRRRSLGANNTFTVTSSGSIDASAGDVYIFKQNFVNQSV
jgi:hypothetical protein